jgi:ATP-dependent DNA helicase RecG
MEKEGSGYDRMYEVLLTQGKPLLTPKEGSDRVSVTVNKRIVNKHIIQFIEKVNQELELSTKELISLGLIAQNNALTAFEYGKILGLSSQEAVRNWIGRLPEFGLVKTKGKTKGTTYFIDPALLKKVNFKGRTTLRKIAPHRLKHLILEDLERYGESSIGNIHQRIGKEIPIRRLRYELNLLVEEEKVNANGERRWRTYSINKKA